jgi:hypothetical protein
MNLFYLNRYVLRSFGISWLIIPLLLLTTWLGARGLNSDPYWLDEVWSVYTSGGAHYGPLSPSDLWARNAAEDPRNAVGYHLLLAGWGAFVGWTEFAARASSLLIGVLAVAWTYRLGRDLASPLVGLAAAAVLGTSAYYVYFLHELRAYSLSVLLTVIIVWTYYRIVIARKPSRLFDVGFALGVVGILYTYYFGVLIVGMLGFYHLLFVPKTRQWWRVPILVGVAALLFVPWFEAMLAGLSISLGDEILHAKSLGPDEVVKNLFFYFSNGVLLLPMVAVGLAIGQRGTRAAWFFVLASISLVVAANYHLQVIESGRERYMLILWPLVAILCGVGFRRMWYFPGKWASVSLLGVWMVIGIHTSLGTELTRDIPGAQPLPWDQVARVLRDNATPDDAVIAHLPVGNWVWEVTTSEYYLHGLPARFTLLESLPGDTAETLRESEREFISGAAQVWLGVDKRMPPASVLGDLQQLLSENYVSCGTMLDLPRMSLALYIRKPSSLNSNSGALRFGDGVFLANYSLPSRVETQLETTFIWRLGAEAPPNVYSVALHVLDVNGQLVAQQDYGLPNEPLACRQSSIDLDRLPRGEYSLATAVYRWETGERLAGTVTATGEQGDRLILGRFTLDG